MLFDRWWQRVLPWGHIFATWRIRLTLCILQHTRVHNRNAKSICSAVFAQMTAKCPYTLQWAACFLYSKLPLPMLASRRHVIGPTRVQNANGNLIASAVFSRLTSVTDWQTKRQTGIPRYSVRCDVIMWGTAKPHTHFMLVRTISPLFSRYLYLYLYVYISIYIVIYRSLALQSVVV